MNRIWIILFVLVVMFGSRAQATIINVPADQPTIQAGVDAALAGDTIVVAPGMYDGPVSVVGKAISLIGDSVSQSVVIRIPGTTGGPVFQFQDGGSSQSHLIGFEIISYDGTDGSPLNGYGVRTFDAHVDIRKNLLRTDDESDNSPTRGIDLSSAITGTSVIADNRIRNHYSEQGSGLLSVRTAVVIQGNTFEGNYAIKNGGAISLDDAPFAVIEGNTFINNTCVYYGGHIFMANQDSTCEIRGNLFVSGTAAFGGAIGVRYDSHARIVDNTFDGCNSTSSSSSLAASAIMVLASTADLLNNIISNCTGPGGAAVANSMGTVTADFNDVWNVSPAAYTNVTPGPNSISADPLYALASQLDFRLHMCSPCLNSGDPNPLYNDPDGSRSDIGAFPPTGSFPAPCPLAILNEDTTHVINHTPTFSWLFVDTSGVQKSYEIEVGIDEDWTVAESWDSGEIISTDTSATYAGTALVDSITYYARIRVSNTSGFGDWQYMSFRMNSTPSVTPVTPVIGDTLTSYDFVLSVASVSDSESDTLSYEYELYSDAALTTLIESQSEIAEGVGLTSSNLIDALPPESQFWWRARTYDGFEHSAWSVTATFHTRHGRLYEVPGGLATIQEAVDVSLSLDTVRVAAGTYVENVDIIAKAIVLLGDSLSQTVVVQSAIANDDVFYFEGPMDPPSEVIGFTVEGAGNRAGVRTFGCHIHIRKNEVRENHGSGGVVINTESEAGSSLVSDNHIHHNSGLSGGGLWAIWADIVVTGNLFENNHVGRYGGGVYLGSCGKIDVSENVFLGNFAERTGGGLLVSERDLTDSGIVSRNLFAYDTAAEYGGGLEDSESNLTIRNNTIDRCVLMPGAARDGAGVWFNSTTAEFYNNIVSNANADSGSAIAALASTINADYNNAWNRTPSEYSNVIPGTNSISADPTYFDSSLQDYRLQMCSPCVDAGDPDPAYNDPDGSRGDIGRYPAAGVLPIPCPVGILNEDALHVINHLPEFSWRIFDTIGGQAAYEIEVGADDDWSVAEYWASGAVASSDTSTTYNGSALVDGNTYMYRIRLNNGMQWGSWQGAGFRMNSTPTIPLTSFPVGGTAVNVNYFRLSVENSTDAESDSIRYDFEIYSDAGLTTLIGSRYAVPQQVDSTMTTVFNEFDSPAPLWWRVRASDNHEGSAWSVPAMFVTIPPTLITVPGDQATIQAAIISAEHGDTIQVQPGVYEENLDFLGKAVVLISSGGPDVTEIQADVTSIPTVSFVSGEEQWAELNGFTLTGEPSTVPIYVNNGSRPLIHNNVFRDYVGSAPTPIPLIECRGGVPTIRYNRFIGNTAAVCVEIWEDSAVVYNNTFVDNRIALKASSGGVMIARNNIVTNGITYGLSGSGIISDYNDVWNNSVNYGSGALAGANDFALDPQLAGTNQDLGDCSPCIDAGDPDPLFNDIDSSRNDLGAMPRLNYSISCPFIGDPNGDAALDAIDLNILIDVGFFGSPLTFDPECPVAREDFDANGSVDVVDINLCIDALFFGGAAPTPCGPQ